MFACRASLWRGIRIEVISSTTPNNYSPFPTYYLPKKNIIFASVQTNHLEKTEYAVTGARMNQWALFEHFCSFNGG
jgi:hypothetical protein